MPILYLGDEPHDALYCWDTRIGQPWCAALEAHVREYHAPIPNLRTAMATCEDGTVELLLKRLLREADWKIQLIFDDNVRARVYGHGKSKVARADTEAVALFAAALAATTPASDAPA